MRRSKTHKVSIIIPVYNEKETIQEVIRQVWRAELLPKFSREIIVVDDASVDGTSRFLRSSRRGFTYLAHERNRGKGLAVRTGLARAKGEIVLIQDADLEYNPRYYPALLKPFRDKRVEVVYGSRLINYPLKLRGKNRTPLPLHWLANHFLTMLTAWLYGKMVTDMETGYKVFRRSLLASLQLRSCRFDFEPEVTAKILKRGVKIIEVPIRVTPRDYSQGKKISWKDGLIAVWTLVKYRFVD